MTKIWRVYVHPHNHPYTQLKKSGIPHTHTHTQSMWGFPVKTWTGSGNTHGDGFICHLYVPRVKVNVLYSIWSLYLLFLFNLIQVLLILTNLVPL